MMDTIDETSDQISEHPAERTSENYMKYSKFSFLLTLSALAASALLLQSCVSVNIGPKPGERSKNVEYTAPAAPYEALKNTQADMAWNNNKNGNSISYFSTCGDSQDPPLDAVARELFSGLTDMKVIKQDEPTFNGRGALQMEVAGKVDGVPTLISAMIFKKDGCTYSLTHVGLPKTFDSDRATFANFVRSFRAP